MAVTTINIDSQVLTFANLAAFPITGTVKTIYIAEDTNFQYYWDGSQYVLLTTDINIPANLIFYATTAPSSVVGYERLVISPDDVDYDNPAVDVPTGAITTTAQLVGEQIADANIFAGNPGVINISTIGEIRRTSGTGTAEFYFEIYQRTSLNVETLRGTSNKTAPISGAVYQQFQVDCLFNNGTWLTTDRVVIKFYADRVAGGSNPNYDFLFGGANPVRTLFPISAQLLLNVPIAIGITGVTGGVTNQVLITDGSGKLGQSELKTVNSNSLLGSGDVSVGTVTSIATAGLLSGGTITSSGTITTSINTNRLVGRSTAGVGVMEEITIGSGLTLSGGTLTAGGGINYNTQVEYFDDFIGGMINVTANFSNPNGTAYLQLGSTRLNTLIDGNAFSNAKGVLQCETQTSATAQGWLGALDMGVRVGDGDIIFENRIQIETLSTSLERFEIRTGLDSRLAFLPSSSILIVYSDNINSGKFQIARRVGSVEVTQDTGITVAAGQWYKIRIEVSTAGTATFFIDGVNVGSIGSLPTTGLGASFKWRKLVGTTNRNTFIDYMYCKQTLNTPR